MFFDYLCFEYLQIMNAYILFFFPVTQHGHPDGGVFTMHAEYLWGYSLPSADMDGRNGRSSPVLPHCITLLLLCKYIAKITPVT